MRHNVKQRNRRSDLRSEVIAPVVGETLPGHRTARRAVVGFAVLIGRGAPWNSARNPRGFRGILQHLRGRSQAAIPDEGGKGPGKHVLVNRREVVY
jgi:hypothetical protein